MQALDPVDAVYVPAEHTPQSVSVSWRDAAVPASDRNLPATQVVQLVAPVVAAYLPLKHTVQLVLAL